MNHFADASKMVDPTVYACRDCGWVRRDLTNGVALREEKRAKPAA